MSHKDITQAAVRAWMQQYPYGQISFAQFVATEKSLGRFWGCV